MFFDFGIQNLSQLDQKTKLEGHAKKEAANTGREALLERIGENRIRNNDRKVKVLERKQ